MFFGRTQQHPRDARGRFLDGPLAPYPHCDADVLHQPGACEACDDYPVRQIARRLNMIRYTGCAEPADWHPCPSEARRPVERIHAWPGNAPVGPNIVTVEGKSWQHLGVTTAGADVYIGDLDTDFDATAMKEIATGGTITVTGTLHPNPAALDVLYGRTPAGPRIDLWLLTQLDVDRAEIHDQCRVAGTSAAAAMKAWPEVRKRTRWLECIADLVNLHAPGPSGVGCQRCTVPEQPWAQAAPFPCLTLRTLATAYADRDGFDPEWDVDA